MQLGAISFTGRSGTFASAGSFTVDDANRTVNTDVLTLTHTTTSALFGGAGMGTGILFRLEDDAGNVDEAGRISAAWVTPTSGAEGSQFVFLARDAGAALDEIARLHRSGNTASLFLSTATNTNTAVQHDLYTGPGDGVLQDVINLLVEGTNVATFYQNDGVYFNDRLAVIDTGSATNTVTTVLRLTVLTSGVAAAGYGVGMSFTGENAAGTAADMARISAEWSDATNASEDSYIAFTYRVAGAALAESTRFSPLTGMAHTVRDAATVTTSDVLTLTHLTSGAAGVAYGTGLLFQGEDAGGNTDDMGRVSFVWADATSTSEDSDWIVQTRRAGGALATVHSINASRSAWTPDGVAALGVGQAEFAVSLNSNGLVYSRNTSTTFFSGFSAYNDSAIQALVQVFGSAAAGTNFGQANANLSLFYSSRAMAVGPNGAYVLTLGTNDAARWQIGATTGDMTPFLSNTYNLGSSTLRVLGGWFGGRLHTAKGADVASGNDITLGSDGNFFDITGATQVNTISATGWQAGDMITLQFDSNPVVAHATAGTGAQLALAGAANFNTTAGDTLSLIYDGTVWRETARTVI